MHQNLVKRGPLWKNDLSRKVLFAFLMLIIIGFIMFPQYYIPLGYVLFALFTLVLFFQGLEILPKYFEKGNFLVRLFWMTFFIRLAFVSLFYLYYFYYVQSPYGKLFAAGAEDATGYHILAKWMAEDFTNGKLIFKVYVDMMGGISDIGYIIWTFLWYYIFGPSLLVHGFFNLIFGSWSVILVYKIARNQFTHQIAIIAATMMMLYPSFFYFSSQSLKEIVMIWLLLVAVLYAQRFIMKIGSRLNNILISILFIFSLAFFRTFLVGLVLFGLIIGAIFRYKKGNPFQIYIFLTFGLLLLMYLGNTVGLTDQISGVLNSASGNFDNTIGRRTDNSIAVKMASIPLFLVYTIPGPLTTFVNTANQYAIWFQLAGFYIRNIFVFFFIIGIYQLFRKAFSENLLLITITLGYLFVMAYSGYVTSGRYQLVVAPFLFIISAVGLANVTSKQLKWFNIFLISMVILILGWNYLKLLGYGML
ncbi:MAG: glycosyltransferase family 39 protein [Bacteroidetes bacterium]|nr:glycosyltransferase family 39 protein [Bacteroidota bacterium]